MFAVDTYQKNSLDLKTNLCPDTNPDVEMVNVRAVKPSDAVLIQEMHDRLSSDSLYYRYLGSNKPSSNDLQCLCAPNGSNGAVIVATTPGPQEEVIGIACFRVNPRDPSTAEPAILVEDRYQGIGLGKRMVLALCQLAIQAGIECFLTYIHPANFRMLGMIKRSGMDFDCKYADGLKEIRVRLQPAG
jgi:RimJ/RimL family protein N-acetyltransferase